MRVFSGPGAWRKSSSQFQERIPKRPWFSDVNNFLDDLKGESRAKGNPKAEK